MIAFYGYPDDTPLRMAIDAAVERRVDCIVIDQAHAGDDDILLEYGDGAYTGYVVVGGQSIALEDITAIYARPLAPLSTGPDAGRAEAWQQLVTDWFDTTTTFVVNRPRAMASNASKPYQQQLISRYLEVPDTLITSDPQEARDYWRAHGAVVYKSVSGIRSIVRRLDEESAKQLDRVTLLPTQFQACVAGTDIRVHVVGSTVLAAEIVSGAVDYRYARRDSMDATLSPIHLDADVERQCSLLAGALELPFCGIDLRRTADGRYVCFEVNPMPGYSYFEAETGLPISAALVDLLSGKAS